VTDNEELAQVRERLDRIERFGTTPPTVTLKDPPLPPVGSFARRKMEADERARQARIAQAKLDDLAYQRERAKRAPQRAKAAADLKRVQAKLGDIEAQRTELMAEMHRLEREANR
jgi:TPR repeat protein